MAGTIEQPHAKYAQDRDPFLTPLQQEEIASYQELEAEANRRGWSPASVISLHPFYCTATGPIHQVDIRVPGVPLDQEMWDIAPKVPLSSGLCVPYVQYVFAQWKPLLVRYLRGQLDYNEVTRSGHLWPIEQAQDAVDQNNRGEDRGGVFCYEGLHLPLSPANREDKHVGMVAKERQLLETAHTSQMIYYENFFSRLNDAYGSRTTTNSWKDLVGTGTRHRSIAKYLKLIGRIREYPVWYTDMMPVGTKVPKCDQCQQNVERGAIICRHCNRVLNPFEAFGKMMIDADTPGAKLVAKRLNDKELKVLIDGGILDQEKLSEWGIITIKKEKPSQPRT